MPNRLRGPAVLVVAALVLAGCVSRTGTTQSTTSVTTTTAPPATTEPAPTTTAPSWSESDPATGPCRYEQSQGEAPVVGVPPGEPETGVGSLTLTTNRGRIAITLTADDTPCTVHSMAFLAENAFFDGTRCHRLTTAPTLRVLQCGDPTGTGTGGPGYTIPDELASATALEDANSSGGTPTTPNVKVYPRGAVAVANTGQPDSGGSQFFLVYADSELPPTYTLFGSVDDRGLKVLDAIAEDGVGPGGQSPEDGEPASQVTIREAVVGD